ncbi:5-formyltetrahydrofolate cyclo-ligase [Listeria valentina]|uniref:5-formyltetrahydrofolate cyclo-ligase n=1 Tax=Listeria valentina TaxID=2705293 RepID=UPI001430C866|nr:5-formyltetrahydrofolate cyclo-ligase [Listeria valentina]
MEKGKLRTETLKLLTSLDKTEHNEKSLKLAELLFETEEWKRAHFVGITLSRHPEIGTEAIIRRAWETGKKIAIPETLYPGHRMQFREYENGDQLIKKKFDLMEPSEKAKLVPKSELSLLVVPGVVFNSAGYRIGFGGGFYDRYLMDFPGDTISLAFSEQVNEELVTEDHDIPVQKVLVI